MRDGLSLGTLGVLVLAVIALFGNPLNNNTASTAAVPTTTTAAAPAPATPASTTAVTTTPPATPAAIPTPAQPPELLKNTFAFCVNQTFGARFETLSPAVQTQLLRDFDRYADTTVGTCTPVSAVAKTLTPPPKPVLGWYLFTLALLTGLIPLAKRFMPGLLEELDEAPSPGTARKFSLSRLVAFAGSYITIVTFVFTVEYSFWALFTRGDASVFKSTVDILLIATFVAFAPYISNKFAGPSK